MKSIIASTILLLTLGFSSSYAQHDDNNNDHGTGASQIDMVKLEKDLNTVGIKGWIHAAVDSKELYVFTYRRPGAFFDYIIFPVATEDQAIMSDLKKRDRHDEVLITGDLIDNRSPVKHINIKALTVVKKHESVVTQSAYFYKGNMDEVLNSESQVFRVHATGNEGQVMVVEYKDIVIPVFIKDPEDQKIAKGLFRGDKIRLNYRVQKSPHAPTHIRPTARELLGGKSPIETLVSIVKIHGLPIEKTGSLVFFPQSPEINRNIFALQEVDENDEPVQYTLVNFDSPELLDAILAKLQKVWDENKSTAENGRNRMINHQLRVTAKGIGNMVSQSQANPQIFLNRLEDIEVTVVPKAPTPNVVKHYNVRMNKI